MTVDRFFGKRFANCMFAIRIGTPPRQSRMIAGNVRYESSAD
jgi:hypothetical protein